VERDDLCAYLIGNGGGSLFLLTASTVLSPRSRRLHFLSLSGEAERDPPKCRGGVGEEEEERGKGEYRRHSVH